MGDLSDAWRRYGPRWGGPSGAGSHGSGSAGNPGSAGSHGAQYNAGGPHMQSDISDMSLWMAGEAGQVSLAQTASAHGLRAAVDQHAAQVRDALGGTLSAGVLVSYARGFVDAAVARGWWPPHRQAHDDGTGWTDWAGEDRSGAGNAGWEPQLDWESLRLAAVCRLFLEAVNLGLLSENATESIDHYRYSPV